MCIKQRSYPFFLRQLEVLSTRVPAHIKHRETILHDLKKARTGFNGERQLDFPLSFLDNRTYYILHDVRLRDENGYFQIDTLLLTTRYILILEVKSWYGTVIFSHNDQVTRRGDDDLEEGFPNPVPQAQLQQYRLKKYLQNYNILLPITFYIVMSFPQTIITSTSPDHPIPPSVIRNEQLFFAINQLDESYMTEKATRSQVLKIAQHIAKSHNPLRQNMMEKYSLTLGQLIKGVICPKCGRAPMIRIHGKWSCRTCSHASTQAHLSALKDYQLLIGNKITNKQARDFLKIQSPNIAKDLLHKSGLEPHGENKGRVYIINLV